MCLEVDECLSKHMLVVNRRRDTEAAHTGTLALKPSSAQGSRDQMGADAVAMGNELVHMLQHIGKLESRMLTELNLAVLGWPDDPWWKAAPSIPDEPTSPDSGMVSQ